MQWLRESETEDGGVIAVYTYLRRMAIELLVYLSIEACLTDRFVVYLQTAFSKCESMGRVGSFCMQSVIVHESVCRGAASAAKCS